MLSPLRDILSRARSSDGARGPSAAEGGLRVGTLALGGVVCLVAAAAILLAAPQLAILGMVSLVAALLLLLPLPLAGTLALVKRLAPTDSSAPSRTSP